MTKIPLIKGYPKSAPGLRIVSDLLDVYHQVSLKDAEPCDLASFCRGIVSAKYELAHNDVELISDSLVESGRWVEMHMMDIASREEFGQLHESNRVLDHFATTYGYKDIWAVDGREKWPAEWTAVLHEPYYELTNPMACARAVPQFNRALIDTLFLAAWLRVMYPNRIKNAFLAMIEDAPHKELLKTTHFSNYGQYFYVVNALNTFYKPGDTLEFILKHSDNKPPKNIGIIKERSLVDALIPAISEFAATVPTQKVDDALPPIEQYLLLAMLADGEAQRLAEWRGLKANEKFVDEAYEGLRESMAILGRSIVSSHG